MKNAIEQTRPKARKAFEIIESITEAQIVRAVGSELNESVLETIIEIYREQYEEKWPDLQEAFEQTNRDVWSILNAKAEGEALTKLKSVQQGEGLWAMIRMHNFFCKTTEQ